ncbi:arginase family protein [Enterococcus alishanensis]
MKKTIRLKIPQWQGGNKPTYAFGSQLLAWLAPKNLEQEEFTIAIPTASDDTELEKKNGVVAQPTLLKNLATVTEKIITEKPDKIITLGGDCLVSQAPFDYLHGKHGEKLGIIWIDSHPDISTPEIYYHEHAMVLGNLLGHGDQLFAEKVQHPYGIKDILFVGLQEPTADEKVILAELNLPYQVQKEQCLQPEKIREWIKQNNFTKTVVHFDLDVLDPAIFKSLYFTEPGVSEFPSESGKMSLKEVGETMAAIQQESEIVGLTIAEYLPWDAENLKKLLQSFDIFS